MCLHVYIHINDHKCNSVHTSCHVVDTDKRDHSIYQLYINYQPIFFKIYHLPIYLSINLFIYFYVFNFALIYLCIYLAN